MVGETWHAPLIIGVDSVGQPEHATPNNKGGGKTPFLPPNNQTRIEKKLLFKKNKHERKQKQRQRKKNTKERK